jgi:hypothetical protein
MIRKPFCIITGVWENRDLFFLRQSLLSLLAYWEDIFPSVPCPIRFTRQNIELHFTEEENINGVGQLLTLFRDQAVLHMDGMVEPQDYNTTLENSRKFKEIFTRRIIL